MTNQQTDGFVIGGRYQLLELVGEGGMAQVYKACDLKLANKIVAVKVLQSELSTNPQFVEQFSNEANAVAQLGGAHVVPVFDSGIDNGLCYIVMEYVEGKNLRTLLTWYGVFDAYDTARMASQVCQALEEAHAYDIVHSDIKPSNIIMLLSGDVKTADFGIAQPSKHEPSQVMGTAQYMSPEQANGEALTPQSDIYSLGVTMYAMTTGALPYDTASFSNAGKLLEEEKPIAPSERRESIDAEFDQIVLKCLERNPEDRFASARRLQLALDDYLSSHELRPVNPPEYWVLAFVSGPSSSVPEGGNAVKITGPAIIGRGEEADIRIASAEVSRLHARLNPYGAYLLVDDLGSSNKTWVNNTLVRGQARCYPGDTLMIGTTNLKIGCKH